MEPEIQGGGFIAWNRDFGERYAPFDAIDHSLWTAARCQRLLRPILSRLELLRKAPGQPADFGGPHTTEGRTAHEGASWSPAELKATKRGEDRIFGKDSTRKRILRTYSCQRRRKQPPARSCVEEVQAVANAQLHGLPPVAEDVSDLIRKRTRNCYAELGSKNRLEPTQAMRQFSKAVSPVHYKIYEGIYHSLESLLRITQPSGTASPCHGTGTRTVDARSSKTGTVRTRSLFNTCLRVVPAYIKYQEEQATMDSWEPRSKYVRVMCSMSSRIYTTLESLGVSDNGWPHLKSVVRAHAIGAICDAVKEGYCELNFASILTILCTHVSAFHEAEELLASSLNAYKYPSPASPNLRFDDIPTMAPLMSLQRYTKHTGHVGLLYRHLQRLLGNQSLPIEWLATRSGAKLFESALEALSVPSHHQDAAAFIGTAITTVFLAASNTAHHDDKGWIHILVATALDALLSLSLICLTVPGVDGHIIKLLQIILMDSCLLLPDTRSDMVGLLIVVNLIVCRLPNEQLSLARFPDADIGRGAHPTAHDSVNIADIPNFITLLATRYEQKLSGGGFEQLCVILDRLKEFSRINTTGETLGIRRIVVDTALLFAQQHPCRKTIEYAIRTAKSAEGYGLPTGVGCFSYRWEDGIGEWVKEMSSTTLEVSTVESASKNKRFMSDEESDVQTPLRPSLKRRRKNVDRNQAHESHTPESLHHTAGLGRSSGYVDADNCCTAAQRRHRLAKLRSKQGLTWHEGWKGVHPRTIPSRCQSRPFDEFVNGVVVAEDGPGTPRAAKQHATNVLKIVQNGAKVHRGRHEGGRPFTRPSESKSYGTVYCDPEHSEDELAM